MELAKARLVSSYLAKLVIDVDPWDTSGSLRGHFVDFDLAHPYSIA